MAKAVLASAIILTALAEPATAYQTEVDPGIMAWKREGLARWHRQQARLENVEEAGAPASSDRTGGAAALPSPPSYVAGVLSAEQVAAYARGAGFPENVIPTMVAIAARESRFNPGAVNSSSGACGLWQIYPAQPGCTDPATNAALAYAKYAASGLSPWGM